VPHVHSLCEEACWDGGGLQVLQRLQGVYLPPLMGVVHLGPVTAAMGVGLVPGRALSTMWGDELSTHTVQPRCCLGSWLFACLLVCLLVCMLLACR
jgi:hypothetical protein